MNTGQVGEQLVLQYYLKEGYALREQNYRTRQGEIDLIVEKDGELVFCEVKTRSGKPIAAPREWVDGRKQQKIRLAAMHYLTLHSLSDPPMRFDVAEVWMAADGTGRVKCFENAF